MHGPERVVCCSLCLCMAVAVFSSVALVYLTALVYMPAKREIDSGLGAVPAMCTTIERLETDECDWYSCGEWCLSKSSHCVKLWAQVRENGTDVEVAGCQDAASVTCGVMDEDFVEARSCSRDADCQGLNERFDRVCRKGGYDDCGGETQVAVFGCDEKSRQCVSKRQHRNCKEDGACVGLRGVFQCEDGLCKNLSAVYDCWFSSVDTHPINCKDKRNCITLKGLFSCTDGQCAKVGEMRALIILEFEI